MRWNILFLSIFALVEVTLAGPKKLVLTNETFEKTLKADPYIVVNFISADCKDCEDFHPIYEEAAFKAWNQGKAYIFCTVNATEYKELAESMGVKEYPTMKFFVYEIPIEYHGKKAVEDILNFLLDCVTTPSIKIEEKQYIIKVKDSKERYCIFDIGNEDKLNEYKEIIKGNQDYKFYHANHELMSEIFTDVEENNVVLIKPDDEKVMIYNDAINSTNFIDFLDTNSIPLVGEPTEKTIHLIFSPKGRKGFFLYKNKAEKIIPNYENEFRKLANELKSNEHVFSIIDKNNYWGNHIFEYFGIDEAELPIFECVELRDTIMRYRYKGSFYLKDMIQFVTDCKEGKVSRTRKSEPVPDHNPGPVYKTVTNTFEKDVFDNDDDVIVKFYAPWCEHCQKLIPVYERIAESFKIQKKLKFLEIDTTLNEVDDQKIEVYPTIKFFAGKDKTKVTIYEGDNSENDIVKFIQSQLTYPIEVPELKAKAENVPKDDL